MPTTDGTLIGPFGGPAPGGPGARGAPPGAAVRPVGPGVEPDPVAGRVAEPQVHARVVDRRVHPGPPRWRLAVTWDPVEVVVALDERQAGPEGGLEDRRRDLADPAPDRGNR